VSDDIVNARLRDLTDLTTFVGEVAAFLGSADE
jgi:hypothetical protein